MEPSTVKCPACQKDGKGEYCVHCGEDLHPDRITVRYITRQFSELYLGFETSRVLRTFRDLALRPGALLNRYFAGDRSSCYNPLDYLLLSIGLYILTLELLFRPEFESAFREGMTGMVESGVLSQNLSDIGSFVNLIYILQIPVLSIGTWLRNRKRGDTLGEHVYANAFILSQLVLYLTIIMLCLRFLPVQWIQAVLIYTWMLFFPAYLVFAYAQWKHGRIAFPRILLTAVFIVSVYTLSIAVSTLLAILLRMGYHAAAALF